MTGLPQLPHLPAAQVALDRDGAFRDHPELFDLLWSNPLTRVLAVHNGKVLLQENEGLPIARLRLLPVDSVPSAQFRVYLGKTLYAEGAEPAGTPLVLAVLSDNSAQQLEPDASNWHELRRNGLGLSERDAATYMQALALANFHQSHVYCPRCGKPTMIQLGGWSRVCLEDGRQIFPRTDPAVIVSVIDAEDRILLGSQGVWEENRWSILAGFVEAGESLTATVVREVEEEAGVLVHDVQYLGSQAWPFPQSLMVGFTAKVDPNHSHLEIRPDGVEIVKVRWFSREDLRAEIAAGSILLPGPITIARTIIEHWYGGPLGV
jgi:NAD+ diphosphatase